MTPASPTTYDHHVTSDITPASPTTYDHHVTSELQHVTENQNSEKSDTEHNDRRKHDYKSNREKKG